jgi:hypothetical protein
VNLLRPKRRMTEEIFLRKLKHAFRSEVEQVKGSITAEESDWARQLLQPHWVCGFIGRTELIWEVFHTYA